MYIPIAILAAFLVLFALSRGAFKASAAYIISKTHITLPFDGAVLERSLAALFISALLSLFFAVSVRINDTVPDGYLIRDGYGSPGRTESLTATIDEDTYPVDLEISERVYSDEEVETMLAEAEQKLREVIKNDYNSGRIDGDIPLDTLLGGDSPVQLTWITHSPEILDWDGSLGEDIPEEGTDVKADALLTLQGKEKTTSFIFRVFPRPLSPAEDAAEKLKDLVEESNPETEEKVNLPEQIDGKTIKWSSKTDKTGYIILISGFIASLLIGAAGIRKKDNDKNRKAESMMCDYPNIVNKLVLLLNAGLSTRLAVKRIALDYKKSALSEKKVKWGYEEIYRTYTEMSMGISERDAYINMGKRALIPKYKALSTLLVQNLLRGSRELIGILEEEADNAFEDRKKRAKIAGEKAGTKLLFPMLIMLGIVLIVITVPAFMNFL